jgi:vacuolar-type H+-ATPase subunit C/Vma6
MVESGSVGTAIDLLQGSPYEEALSFAMKRYSAEQNLFPLEVALDLNYWRRLWTGSGAKHAHHRLSPGYE